MKNHNEETQILSQEAEEQLDSNDNKRKASDGDSEENINQNQENNANKINENENLNIEEMKLNNVFKNEINNNNNEKENIFGPVKNYKNYDRHFGHLQTHAHNHNFSNPRYIIFFILGFVKLANHQILQLFNGLTMSIDILIRNSNFHPLIKRIFHTKQILLLIYVFNIQYLLSSIENISFLYIINKYSLKLFIYSVIGFNLHYYIYRNKLFIEKDEELEKFILRRNPQIKRANCEICDTIKICRSGHCFYCNKCVKKFQLHSDWFTICIGANNELVYGITLFFSNIYIFISNIIFWYYILVRTELLKYLVLVFSLFGLLGLYILFNSLKFLYNFFFEHLFINLTLYELNNARRLTYLWSDSITFFNPFNKGLQRNIEEMLVNTFDVDIYSDYKNFGNQNLSEIIDDERINQQDEEINYYNEIDSFKVMIKLVEHFDPVITSKGNIYKFVDGKEIINWNRLIIFTIFDIINTPSRENMVKRAKMVLQQKEIYKQNSTKNNENEEKKYNIETNETIEVIDNNDNKEKIENKNYEIKKNDEYESNEKKEDDNNDEKDENNDNENEKL